MKTLLRVKVKFETQPPCEYEFLVEPNSENEIFRKIKASWTFAPFEILSIKKSSICCFFGDPTYEPYIGTVKFIGDNMESVKKRYVAVGAKNLLEAYNIIETAFSDLSSIKHIILSEQQLRHLEYNHTKEMSYIDFETVGLVESNMTYIPNEKC